MTKFVRFLAQTSLFDDTKGTEDLHSSWPLPLITVRNVLLALGYDKMWLDTILICELEKIYKKEK